MTILNEKNLLVTAFAHPNDERPHLNGVAVEPDGTTVAVNGHVLACITPQKEVEADTLETSMPVEPADKTELLRLDDARDMAAELKRQRKAEYPTQRVLARLKSENGSTLYERSDPSSRRQFHITPREDKFPPYNDIIPNFEGDDYATVGVDAKYLRLLADTVNQFRDDRGRAPKGVTLHIPTKDPLSPIVATAKNENTEQELTVIIMPLRD